MKIKHKLILVLYIIITIVFIKLNKVYGITIVLDAGHGAHDVGANSNGIYEKTINLKVASYLNEYLKDYKDLNVIMTRTDDTFLEVFDRAMVARKQKADLMISLHFNSATTNKMSGAEVYVSNNTSLDKYKKETSKFAELVLNNLNKIGIENRGVKTRLITNDDSDRYTDGTIADYYGIIRYCMRGCRIDSGVIKPKGAVPAKVEAGEGIPAVIIEHCYINNSNDRKFITNDASLMKIAKADADAITEYFKLSKKDVIKFKIKDNVIISVPDISLDDIKQKYKEVSADSEMTTGSKLTIDEKTYTLIKLGDCNCDGKVTPADYVKVKNYIMNVSNLNDELKISADVNEDGKITPADYVKIKNHIMNVNKIKLGE